MEPRISLVTLGVADLPRARSFYEALGWEGAQQPDDKVCFFQAGGMVLGLWAALGGHGAPGSSSPTTSARPKRSALSYQRRSEPVALSCDPRRVPSGVVHQEPSPILTGTYGRSPTTPGGRSTRLVR